VEEKIREDEGLFPGISLDNHSVTNRPDLFRMNFIIQAGPKHLIRNEQAGDWHYWPTGCHALVDNSLTADSQLAVAVHELVEAYLCKKAGITDEAVCAFDKKYEAERKKGKHGENDEPGDDPRSPYREQHMAATHVERAVCAAIGLNWKEHCDAI